jgi:hypothetical protein
MPSCMHRMPSCAAFMQHSCACMLHAQHACACMLHSAAAEFFSFVIYQFDSAACVDSKSRKITVDSCGPIHWPRAALPPSAPDHSARLARRWRDAVHSGCSLLGPISAGASCALQRGAARVIMGCNGQIDEHAAPAAPVDSHFHRVG